MRIKELRSERELSQQRLANAIGISQSTIAKIETGRNEATASTLRKLADYFEVSADYLLERTEETNIIVSNSLISTPNLGNISPIEEQLILDFRKLPADTQNNFAALFHNLATGG